MVGVTLATTLGVVDCFNEDCLSLCLRRDLVLDTFFLTTLADTESGLETTFFLGEQLEDAGNELIVVDATDTFLEMVLIELDTADTLGKRTLETRLLGLTRVDFTATTGSTVFSIKATL